MTRTGVLLGLALVAFAFAASPAAAAAKTFTMNTGIHSDATIGAHFYQGTDTATRNPTLSVDPGDSVTVNLTNKDGTSAQAHNLHVTGEGVNFVVPTTGFLDAQGETAQGTFTVPSAAGKTLQYVCDVHPTTMKGTFQITGTAATDDKGTPGFGVLLGLAAIAGAVLLVRRRA